MPVINCSEFPMRFFLVGFATTFVSWGQLVFAQEVLSGATDQSVEEIIVTTRKREENLQEVPIAIDVFNEDEIARLGIRGLDDITKLSPSLQLDRSFSQNSLQITIRGLSNTRGRSNTAFLIDGVDVTSETTGTNAGSPLLVNQRLLADVERIEVVKGPQSALYGRSAFAGAINYISKTPSDKLEGNISVDVNDNDQQEVAGGVSIPISETLGLRLSGVIWDDDGYYRNEASGKKIDGGDGYGISATALWTPADNFNLKTRFSYSDDEYDPGAISILDDRAETLIVPANAATVTSETEVELVGNAGNGNNRKVYSSEDLVKGGEYPGTTVEIFRGSLIAGWDITPEYTLTSISGFTDADMTQRYDLDRLADGRPDAFLGHGEVDTEGNTKQYSQELRFATNWDDQPINFTAGAQWWYEERDDDARNIVAVCRNQLALPDFFQCGGANYPLDSWQAIYQDALSNIGDYRDPKEAKTDHGSFYLMMEWDITDRVRFTLEDRFVTERFEVETFIGAGCINAYPIPPNFNVPGDLGQTGCFEGFEDSGSIRSSYQTPKFTLDWSVTDNAMLYASAGKGQKPAGISLLTVPVPFDIPLYPSFFYDPEKMWAYELGAKTNWSGSMGNLMFNASAFYQDYTDKQTNTQQQVGIFLVGVVTNASSATVTGLELESTWDTPIEGLSLGAAYTWLDTEYDDFKDPTRSAGRIAIAGDCSDIVVVRGNDHCNLNLSGNQLEFAPEHSVVLTGRYENTFAQTAWNWFFETNASYQSERYTTADNFQQLDEYWLVDARIGLTGESWDVTAYLNNVFDDNTIRSRGGSFDFPAYSANPDPIGGTPDGTTTGYLSPPRTGGIRVSYFFE